MVPHRLAWGSNIWQRPEDHVLTMHASTYTLKALSIQAPQPHRRLTLGIKRMLALSEGSQLVHIVSIPPIYNDPTSQTMPIWTHILLEVFLRPEVDTWTILGTFSYVQTYHPHPPLPGTSVSSLLARCPTDSALRDILESQDRRLALWQKIFYSLLRRVAEPGEMELTLLL